MSHRNNIVRIKAIYNALGSLADGVVFVGGATLSLYADRLAEEVRPTEDVDILVEIWTYQNYAVLEEQLRKMGFENDSGSKVLCRYRVQGIIVDVMPIGENALGFSNKWYPEGFMNAVTYKIDDQHNIKIFTAPYFIASKLEAFKHPRRKDNNNGIQSSDFEDIIFVFENRFSIWEELRDAPDSLKLYLIDEFKILLEHPLFEEWVNAHAGFGSPPPSYYILRMLEEFVSQE